MTPPSMMEKIGDVILLIVVVFYLMNMATEMGLMVINNALGRQPLVIIRALIGISRATLVTCR